MLFNTDQVIEVFVVASAASAARYWNSPSVSKLAEEQAHRSTRVCGVAAANSKALLTNIAWPESGQLAGGTGASGNAVQSRDSNSAR